LEKGRFLGHVVPSGGYVWFCPCGNELFKLTPEGVFCPMCGKYQVGFEPPSSKGA
jgi:hypothetical protein